MKAEEPSSAARRLTVFGAWVAILFLMLPITIVIPVSFTPERYLSLPGGEAPRCVTTAPLAKILSGSSSLIDSLIVGLSSTALAVTLGTMAAIGCWRISTRLSETIRMVLLAPMIVPAIVHALGFYRTWADLGLIDTYLGLVLAHSMKGLPYVVISVSAALANVDLRLEQAARGLGATVPQTLWLVIVPAALPGVYVGAVFAFVTSWDELVVNLFGDEPQRLHPAAQDSGRHPGQCQPLDRGRRHRADYLHDVRHAGALCSAATKRGSPRSRFSRAVPLRLSVLRSRFFFTGAGSTSLEKLQSSFLKRTVALPPTAADLAPLRCCDRASPRRQGDVERPLRGLDQNAVIRSVIGETPDAAGQGIEGARRRRRADRDLLGPERDRHRVSDGRPQPALKPMMKHGASG